MGLQHPSTSKLALTYHSREIHSMEGMVSVYRLKGQALYLFEKPSTSPSMCKVARQISSLRCNSLCSYYGNLLASNQVQLHQQCSCISEQAKQTSSFWSFQNYTLADQAAKNQHQHVFPTEEKIWALLSSLAEASNILIENGLFVDCTLQNVYLSPLRNFQLYWGHAALGNSHRVYYKTLLGQGVGLKAVMSPQQLKALRQGKLLARLDLQKAVVHSIGILALLYSNSISDYYPLYDYKNQQINQSLLSQLIRQCRSRFSDKLAGLLYQMVVQGVAQRFSLKNVSQTINANVANTLRGLEANKYQNEVDTCVSSKVTIKNVRF